MRASDISKIVETGTIAGRGYCIVERYRYGDGWPLCHFEYVPPSWLCGHLDASDLDGIDYEDKRFEDAYVELTYSGRGVPGEVSGAPQTGWWLGLDTMHPGMEDATAETVRVQLAALAAYLPKIGKEADNA